MTYPTFSPATTSPPLSADQQINALLWGTQWGMATGSGVTLSYSFPWVSGNAWFYGNLGGSYSDLNEHSATYHYALSPTQQDAFRSALQLWSDVANISFYEISETSYNVGDLRIAWTSASDAFSDGSEPWGWAYYPDGDWPSGGDIWISSLNSDTDGDAWTSGSYNALALLHELGHALGLKHPFDGDITLDGILDNRSYTIMSYTDAWNNIYPSVEYVNGVQTTISYYVNPETPMVLDIAAIQYLYGANMTYRTGDDTYTFDPTQPFFKTIWDAGGSDSLSASNFSLPCTLDLTPGSYSSLRMPEASDTGGMITTYDGTDNLGIAYNCIIENAIGGSGDDVLIGNSANNALTGNAGDDTLDGDTGIDTAIYAGAFGSFTITLADNDERTLVDQTGAEGTDTLAAIERLSFADKKLALDLNADGNAGKTLEFIGMLSFSHLKDASAIGRILSIFDQGQSMNEVCQQAIDVGLTVFFAGSDSNLDLARLLYLNVVGSEASVEYANTLAAYMQGSGGSMSQADFMAAVAELALNQQHIDLVGLQSTGIEYC